MEWIDIHTHLDMLEESPEEALESARAVGVVRVITIGTNPGDHARVLELCDAFPGRVFGTLGVHPHDAATWSPRVAESIRNALQHPRLVAIGEIGLDYFYKNADPELQKTAFREQVELACTAGLPVEIHTREADLDTIEILSQFRGQLRGVIHCFTGTQWLANKALDLGLNISISGIVTFKNAVELREVVQSIPLERMHVETDAPFLAPVPHRGKKNTPAYVVDTARFVAELKGVALDDFATQMLLNAHQIFPRLLDSSGTR